MTGVLPAAPAAAAAPAAIAREAAIASWSTDTIRGLGQLHLELAAIDLTTVEALHRLFGFFRRGHLDEPEATRAPSVPIGDDHGRFDATRLGEQLAEPIARRGERETADEEFLRHEGASLLPPDSCTPQNAEDAPETRSDV